MVDLSGKYVSTQNSAETSRLLKMAIAQGYRSKVGVMALENYRLFHFIGTPYKSITLPNINKSSEKVIRYVDLCGDETEELKNIVNMAVHWCRAHGYSHVGIYANDKGDEYDGKGMAISDDGVRQHVKLKIQKPVKISVDDIEKKFGYPIEIIPAHKGEVYDF